MVLNQLIIPQLIFSCLSVWYWMDLVRRNSFLVTCGSLKVVWDCIGFGSQLSAITPETFIPFYINQSLKIKPIGTWSQVFSCKSDSLPICTLSSHLLLTLYILTSVCIFYILFSRHFLQCWQEEFVYQSRTSLVGDHFLILVTILGSISVSGQLPTYPSPNPTLTLTCSQLTVVELGEG